MQISMLKPFVVLFRSCMPLVIAVGEIKLPVDGAHTDYLHLFTSTLLSFRK